MLEWADYAAIQAECGNLAGNELTRNSSGNTQSQSSQLTEPLWTDPGLKSEISVSELISTKKKQQQQQHQKNPGGEWVVEYSPKILTCEEKSQPTNTDRVWNNKRTRTDFINFELML